MSAELITELVQKTHAARDRGGEYHFTCPNCGHESTPKSPHCSFSSQGWHCFSCGAGGSLNALGRLLLVENCDTVYLPHIAKNKPKKPSCGHLGPLVTQFAEHPRRNELWNLYKPLSLETMDRMQLGVGILPYSRCKHERLIVPVWNGPQLVGLRGRQLDCDCGKWLASAGWSIDLAPLYNSDALGLGQVIWILENPVDALALTERTEYVGIATYSVSYWTDVWTKRLQEAQPELIVVAFDNDLVGNGGGPRREEFIRMWLEDPKHKVVPPANGPALANKLLEAGLPATLYDWVGNAEYKSDIGTLLMQEAKC